MKTGIVILNYNDYENTIQMLNQIKDYTCLDKIVIVDNCSTDQSVEKLKVYENKKIVLLEASENKGYASGNNFGNFTHIGFWQNSTEYNFEEK